jgi:4-hydroxythreonine-4-phosphate dehydrogenase
MGDPAGVGPELCLRILRDDSILRRCVPVVFGDIGVLLRVADATGLASPPAVVTLDAWNRSAAVDAPVVVDCGAIAPKEVRPGTVRAECGRAAVKYVETAVTAALRRAVTAIATGPIHKEALHLAGVPFPGHTELLAALTGAKRICMMMASDKIVVSLATIHVGLAQVKALLSKVRILDAIELTADALRRIGKTAPRIVVCGLNPHGGEQGLFGNEEQEVIAPAIAAARAQGLHVDGPLPSDTAFIPQKRSETDAYIAMYHDQGLIPFKMLAFDKGVNVTLGLPIVRTSVDHGTAFDIAWQGKASTTSLAQSVLWAIRLAQC